MLNSGSHRPWHQQYRCSAANFYTHSSTGCARCALSVLVPLCTRYCLPAATAEVLLAAALRPTAAAVVAAAVLAAALLAVPVVAAAPLALLAEPFLAAAAAVVVAAGFEEAPPGAPGFTVDIHNHADSNQ
jgi:hypothetical protein